MKKLIELSFVMLSLILTVACSPGDRKADDLTDPEKESVSPNQVITEEERAKKDSTTTDVFGEDSAAQKVDR